MSIAQVKANEQDIVKLLACLSDMDSLCRRCAIELDLHIGETYAQGSFWWNSILSPCCFYSLISDWPGGLVHFEIIVQVIRLCCLRSLNLLLSRYNLIVFSRIFAFFILILDTWRCWNFLAAHKAACWGFPGIWFQNNSGHCLS